MKQGTALLLLLLMALARLLWSLAVNQTIDQAVGLVANRML